MVLGNLDHAEIYNQFIYTFADRFSELIIPMTYNVGATTFLSVELRFFHAQFLGTHVDTCNPMSDIWEVYINKIKYKHKVDRIAQNIPYSVIDKEYILVLYIKYQHRAKYAVFH